MAVLIPNVCVCFAYNPVFFELYSDNHQTAYFYVFDENDNTIGILTKDCIEETVKFDISAILRTMFKDNETSLRVVNIETPYASATKNTIQCVPFKVGYRFDIIKEITTYPKTYYAVNAVGQLGDKTNYLFDNSGRFLTDSKSIKKYPNFPLDVGVASFVLNTGSAYNYYRTEKRGLVFVTDEGAVDYTLDEIYQSNVSDIDGQRGTTLYDIIGKGRNWTPNFQGIYNIQIEASDGSYVYIERWANDGVGVAPHVITARRRLNIEQKDCIPENPMYIRWLNVYGGFDYQMFGVRQYNIKELSEVAFIERYIEDVTNSTMKTVAIHPKGRDKIRIGAEGLTDNEINVLSQIVYSPFIQRYDTDKKKWFNVYIDNSSLEVDNGIHTHDIELELIINNNRYMQTL